MDAKEVELKGKAITKAISSQDPPANIIAILEDLKTGVTASEKLLRETKIGVTVNKLKAHGNSGVAKKAGELVAKWKVDVKRNASSGSATPKGANGSHASPAPAASPAPKAKAKHSVPPEKRNAKEDKVDTNRTGNKTRDNCLKLMYDGLAFMSEEMPDHVLSVATAVENAAYQAFKPETSQTYKDKMRSLFQNLKNKSNPELRNNVLSGVFTPERFVSMTSNELMSASRMAEDAKLMSENMKDAMVPQEEKSVSASLQCGKCGQKKVSYTQAQTRSADEPMTTFCECMNCGKRWKFS